MTTQPDDLAALLSAGERAAFHGPPGAGFEPLERAVTLAHLGGHDAEATAAGWLLGVCLASAGRYGAALAVLEPMADHAPVEPERQMFSSLAAATVASVHRQLGDHEEARRHDSRAEELADDAADARFDAALGLAADAVGLADADAAEHELARAAALAESRASWWRQRVRLDWVRAEIALLRDVPETAIERASSAVSLAEASGAPRHVAKSLLFEGVARAQATEYDEAIVLLRRSSSLAESLGALPLVWPARAVLATLLATTSPAEAAGCLGTARGVIRRIQDGLPPQLAAAWQARPDIAAVLAD